MMNAITDHLDRADVYRVNGGPMLTSYFENEDGGLSFVVDEGDAYVTNETIIQAEVANARVTGNVITMTNTDGEEVRVETFRITPHAITTGIHASAFARYVEDLYQRTPNAHEALTEQLDELIWSKFGGDEASVINNQGPTHQIIALINRGDASAAVGVLGSVAHKSAGQVLTTLRSYL